MGKTRQEPTPEKDVILRNWERFFNHWHNKTHDGVRVLSQTSILELKKLKRHIQSDCLSNIPVGAGTGRNERLHAILNSHGILRSPTVGVALADAAIASCFHYENAKKTEKDLTYTPPFAVLGDGKPRQRTTGSTDKGFGRRLEIERVEIGQIEDREITLLRWRVQFAAPSLPFYQSWSFVAPRSCTPEYFFGTAINFRGRSDDRRRVAADESAGDITSDIQRPQLCQQQLYSTTLNSEKCYSQS
ncbi:hypothetical protein Bbelb_307720 [Branchiostoma belcheri]|nr:hypothetical protein Bbelb_307720 [Branchiostoma belcheri]